MKSSVQSYYVTASLEIISQSQEVELLSRSRARCGPETWYGRLAEFLDIASAI